MCSDSIHAEANPPSGSHTGSLTGSLTGAPTGDDAWLVQARNLSKCYQIYAAPQDRLKQALWRGRRTYYKAFWALRELSLELRRGETLGIIGRNGSGKSTLLQLLCGTLSPTSGAIQVNGRVAALLELGAGFNPEFTGRENVFMNGALLGLSRAEVEQRFDAIAAFAEIGEFLEQPVKLYSSGMFVRLAFSVAIHAEPDLLIVDEALAVGDAAFQAKCMARMRRLMNAGMSLLFVSHDIGAVKSLCQRALLLDQGRCLLQGETAPVVDRYQRLLHAQKAGVERVTAEPVRPSGIASTAPAQPRQVAQQGLPELADAAVFEQLAAIERHGDGRARLLNVRLLDANGQPCAEVGQGQPLRLQMLLEAKQPLPLLAFGYHLRDRTGIDIGYADSLLEACHLRQLRAGQRYLIEWPLALPLRTDHYSIACALSAPAAAWRPEPRNADPARAELMLTDFVAVAVQFRVHGPAILNGYLRLVGAPAVQSLPSVADEPLATQG